ncbi:MAG: hypothetical protein ACI9FY_001563 [Patiriisocius sp.]
MFEISIIGTSELGKEIPMVSLGSGKKVILAWSQMHGNESTTTKALIDFLAFIFQKKQYEEEISIFLATHTVHIIPILNPDGAEAYTRCNINGVDLNRDAQDLSQKESQILRAIFDAVQPDLCLNMHDQRTIYGLPTGKTAAVSFLSPSADASRGVTAARETAMLAIAAMYKELSKEIPGQIGRYDDGFNLNCVGDTFTHLGVPTILFEAGHFPGDYNREVSRALIVKSLLIVFNISVETETTSIEDYNSIPENQKTYCDILLKDARLSDASIKQNIAIQFTEVLEENTIFFIPTILELDSQLIGHKVIQCDGDWVEFNNQKSVSFNEKLTIVYNKTKESEILLRI